MMIINDDDDEWYDDDDDGQEKTRKNVASLMGWDRQQDTATTMLGRTLNLSDTWVSLWTGE